MKSLMLLLLVLSPIVAHKLNHPKYTIDPPVTVVEATKPKTDQEIYNRVVKLKSVKGSCSGEQVSAPSGQTYILTAGHCRDLEDERGTITVEKENGESLQRRIIAEDPNSDLLLLEGIPGMPGLRIADNQEMRQEIRTFTHGAGYKAYKTAGSLIQSVPITIMFDPEECEKGMPKFIKKRIESFFGEMEACVLSINEIATTAMIVPGSSGGAVVDSLGDLVGVVSAGNPPMGYLVSLKDIQTFLSGY